MAVNCGSCVVSTGLLNYAGRKTLLGTFTAGCGFFLFIQAFATWKLWGTIELIMTMLFVICFEFGPGPIVWLYMGEILNDKGLSIGGFLNWTFVLIVSIFTPTLIHSSIGAAGTFLIFGICNVIATVFIMIFMKETKGLSDDQVKNLYKKNDGDALIN